MILFASEVCPQRKRILFLDQTEFYHSLEKLLLGVVLLDKNRFELPIEPRLFLLKLYSFFVFLEHSLNQVWLWVIKLILRFGLDLLLRLLGCEV